ncbi:MAG: PHB depolymerase family esterase [Actinomycetota bacterium]|nr:PHB depolymerase family esterase [Actinomycetota bacterium]
MALGCLALAAAACGRADADADEAATQARTIEVDGAERTYRLHLPPDTDTDNGSPLPLVVVLHGGGGSGRQAERSYGWNEVADREGFAVAFPDALHRAWAVSDACCGRSVTNDVDDVAFVLEVLDDIGALDDVDIDPDRIAVAGMSNGGMMAYRLACDTDRFAAIGAVGATLLGECDAPAPVSVLHIHGTADESVPFDGGPGRRDNGGEGNVPLDLDGPAVEDVVARWRGVADCAAPTTDIRSVVDVDMTRTSAGCPDGRAVELITIDGAGHQWPGGQRRRLTEHLLDTDAPSGALDATEELWVFFADHPAPHADR